MTPENHVFFLVAGEVKGKERPRVVNGHAYTPKSTAAFEANIRAAYIQRYGKKPLFEDKQSLFVTIDAQYPIPLSTPKKTKALMIGHIIKPVKKPDVDNVAKAILDALNGYAYHDDAQITKLLIRKRYGNAAYVMIKIEPDEQT